MPKEKVCRICFSKPGGYICPKCNINFCSLNCYKTHSSQCTTQFASESIDASIKSTKIDNQTKQKMLRIWKEELDNLHLDITPSASPQKDGDHIGDRRTPSNQNFEKDGKQTDDPNENTSTGGKLTDEQIEKLQKLAKANKLKMADLPDGEKSLFLNAIGSGLLDKFFAEWVPWWEIPFYDKSTRKLFPVKTMVQLIEKDGNQFEEYRNAGGVVPALPSGSPKISFGAKPFRPDLKFDLVNLILSYCLVIRLYNGDISSPADHLDFSANFIFISSVLFDPKHVAFSSLSHSANDFISRAAQSFRGQLLLVDSTLRDGALVFQRLGLVLRCLEHSRRLLAQSLHFSKTRGRNSASRRKVFRSSKKLEFFVAWASARWDAERFGAEAENLGILWKAKADRLFFEKAEKRAMGSVKNELFWKND